MITSKINRLITGSLLTMFIIMAFGYSALGKQPGPYAYESSITIQDSKRLKTSLIQYVEEIDYLLGQIQPSYGGSSEYPSYIGLWTGQDKQRKIIKIAQKIVSRLKSRKAHARGTNLADQIRRNLQNIAPMNYTNYLKEYWYSSDDKSMANIRKLVRQLAFLDSSKLRSCKTIISDR